MTLHPKQTTRAELISELEAAGAAVSGNKIKCPFHDDRHPSAGVFQGADGIWRFKCHGCDAKGDVFDVQARRTGRPLAEILRQTAQDAPQSKNAPRPDPQAGKKAFDSLEAIYGVLSSKHGGKLEALHEYTGASGEHVQYVIRWRGQDGKKYIRPAVKTAAGYELRFPEQRVLYRLPTLAGAKTVIITEGELKADVLAEYGFPCTTSSGGSKAAERTDWRPLAGKNIIVWPDYDLPGKQYADEVRRTLEGLGCRIKTVDPSRLDLQESEDAKDYIDQLKNAGYSELEIKESLNRVLAKAESTGAGQEVVQVLSAIGAGQYEPIETGFHALDDLVQILPGSLNLICGSPGSSKSLLVLQLAARWHKEKIKTAVFELEKDRVFHLRRALAQESELAMITNNKWVRHNAGLAQQTAIEYADWMDSFGRMIYACPDRMVYQKDVIEWVQQRADNGCRAVIIDPATKGERQDEPYKADGLFVQQLARIATTTRLIIFLVLHPSKTIVPMPDLAQIAGGAAYGRFADNVIWLENHEPKTSSVKTCCGTTEAEHDRTLWVLKSRDGAGTGSRIAFTFNTENLTLRELGRIGKKQK